MDALSSYRQCALAAIPFSPRRHRLGHRCVTLGVIGACGALAFLFSVVSPYDDDIQQEFVQDSKAKQFVLATYRFAPNVRGLRTNTARCALVPPRPLSTCCHVIGCVSIEYKVIKGASFDSSSGPRSPPSESF